MSDQLTVAARPGEVWAFSIDGEEVIVGFAIVAGFFGEIEFRTVMGNVLKLPTTVYTDARRIWPERQEQWGFSKRREEAHAAWARYRRVVSNAELNSPTLFEAGFTLGVSAAQHTNRRPCGLPASAPPCIGCQCKPTRADQGGEGDD